MKTERNPVIKKLTHQIARKADALSLFDITDAEELARRAEKELELRNLIVERATERELQRYQYPSATVNWTFSGDREYAERFRVEGQKLLYQVKNNMQFRRLGQLRAIRYFHDGTIVIASSVFGLDSIEIIAGIKPTEEDVKEPLCILTLFNVPEVVPPMRWYADGVHDEEWLLKNPGGKLEVEGVDYIKTYYNFALIDCSNCSGQLSFTVCESDQLIAEPAKCTPFTFLKPEGIPYYQGNPKVVPPIPPDPSRHCLYSLYDTCQAEIIKFGADENGSYFIWKAYTEWGTSRPEDFSRTGLGYLLLQGFLFEGGRQLCQSQEYIVKVDCCAKIAEDRQVEIWWENFGTCQPFILYSGVVYNAICKLPTSIPLHTLIRYGCWSPRKSLCAIPEIKGSCIPVEWSFTGALALDPNSDKNDNSVFYTCNEQPTCYDTATITLRDRCGTQYTVHALSCCESAAPLVITYTTLLMGCDGRQNLSVTGGCAPYRWRLTGGGSLDSTVGREVVYTAPSSNPNCQLNPAIVVEDCCGQTAQISIAVNCYTPDVYAYGITEWEECEGCWCHLFGCGEGVKHCFNWRTSIFLCDGSIRFYCNTAPCGTSPYPCNGSPNGVIWSKVDCKLITSVPPENCWTHQCQCGNHSGNCECNKWYDIRTEAMKLQGCCPINPATGLPY